jgi:hypothetical protein
MTESEQEISFMTITNGISHSRLLFTNGVFTRFSKIISSSLSQLSSHSVPSHCHSFALKQQSRSCLDDNI